MSKRDPLVPLRHMLDFAREAARFAEGKTREDIENDRLLNLALVHLIELVGEAANRVPREDRDTMPGIPWARIVGCATGSSMATISWTMTSCGRR